jgi:hypothetical protein
MKTTLYASGYPKLVDAKRTMEMNAIFLGGSYPVAIREMRSTRNPESWSLPAEM